MKYRGYAKKSDANQTDIVAALRKIGCEVEHLTGKAGMSDLLVNLGNRLFLLEIKNPKGKNKVNDDQKAFHKRFKTTTVRTIEEALKAVTKQ